MSEVDVDRLILVGTIIATHGTRGEVKVQAIADDVERLAALAAVFVGAGPATARRFDVKHTRVQVVKKGRLLLLHLESVDDIEHALPLVKQAVYALDADLPLEDDEYFVHDLVGLTVETVDGDVLGSVKDIMNLPAQDVLVVRLREGHEVLIPMVDEFVAGLDRPAGKIIVRLIDGLLS